MASFKRRLYKLMCMNTHPSTSTIAKYADESTPVNHIEKPEVNDTGHISEAVYNCIAIAASILDEHLKLGIKILSVDELLATL